MIGAVISQKPVGRLSAAAAVAVMTVVSLAPIGLAGAAVAQQTAQRTVLGERYEPTIWIDPDGCEHWVMDDGAEGYMSPHVDRNGVPVCHEVNLCGVVNTDTLFATDSARIRPDARARLRQFFAEADAISYNIVGHTDSRAADEYNMRLSLRRAHAVAQVARSTGARIAAVQGHGERRPKASNATVAGMAQNRRVEIMCWR